MYKFLQRTIYLWVLLRVQAVDVALESDTTILVEIEIGRQPLESVRPSVLSFGTAKQSMVEGWGRRLIFNVGGDDLALAGPLCDGIIDADNLVLYTLCDIVDEWIHGWVDQVADLFIGPGMPVRIG